MADSNFIPSTSGGSTFRGVNGAGGPIQEVVRLSWGPNTSETLVGTGANGLPIQDGGNSITVDGTFFQATQPVSAASLPLPTGAATDSSVGTRLSESDFDSKTGALTETAPATDTASSGLNGRLQRLAQRLTSVIAQLPAALVGGRLDTNNGAWLGSTAPTVGQKAMASSMPMVIASDQTSLPVSATVGTPVNAQISDGTRTATVRDTGASDSLNVAIVDGSGAHITSFGGTGGTALVDEASFTEGTTAFTPVGGVFNDTITSNPTEDQAAAARITAFRAVHVNLRDAGGAELSVGGGTQYTEDAAAAANPVGNALNLIRKDTLAAETTTDGDNVAARGTNKGEQYVKHVDSIAVTGTFFQGTQPVSNASLPLPTGAATAALQTQPGVDVGDVTINNASGASAVNIQDGGNSLTVDGSVSITGAIDTEMPAAAALADATANPTTPLIGSATELFNGTTWDRARGDTTNGMDVDVTRLPALVAGTANIGDVDVLTLPALPAGTNNIGDVDVLTVIPGVSTTSLGKAEAASHGATGDTGVFVLGVRDDLPSTHSGSNGLYEAIHISPEGGVWMSPTPAATGGLNIFRSLDLDETEEQVKATAGTLHGWYIANLATATRFVKFYDATAATVVVGTTTPVMTLPIPGNSTDDTAANVLGGMGIAFSTAITVAATTGIADADTGAPGVNDVVVNLFTK